MVKSRSASGNSHAPRFEIFVEGGGNDNDALRTECRQAFRTFLERAGLAGGPPRVFPCGSRTAAFDNFKTAHSSSAPNDVNLLLVDSEDEIAPEEEPWTFVKERDGWEQPARATKDQLHFMVRCTESWFLADRGALAKHFSNGFIPDRLPKASRPIESIPKKEVLAGINDAIKDAKTVQRYEEGRDSFLILSMVDPQRVAEASPRAKAFLDHVRRIAEIRRAGR